MFSLTKSWEVYPRAPQSHFDQFPNIAPLIVQLLYNRGVYLPADVQDFVAAEPPDHDPFLMKGIKEAVSQILQTIESAGKIVIYGDYDADGVTATALMVQALKALNADVAPYIPNRFEEGYGLNQQAIAELAAADINLIISVDCGIRSSEDVAYGNSLGLKFIITDHHQVPQNEAGEDVIPPAIAVVNPKQTACQYPFKELPGVGIAYTLVCALRQSVGPDKAVAPDLQDKRLLDLVAIGTVADMVPLIGTNRAWVKRGLMYINRPQRLGLQSLIDQAQLRVGHITAGSIGFTIGPRLNAAGRLTHAWLAYNLLVTTDLAEAQHLAAELSQINASRQTMTQQFVDLAETQILANRTLDPIYLITDTEFNRGIVGLVASRLTDKFYRPTLVAQQEGAFTTGSGRSIPEFDITHTLDQCADLLIKYGGHAAAAGFTIETSKLPQFRARLLHIAHQTLANQTLQKTLLVDAKINLRGVKPQLVEEIQALQPFGYNNPTPKFTTPKLVVKHHRLIGKDNTHLKLKLFDGKSIWDAVGFNMGRTWPDIPISTEIDAVYQLEFNTWNGQTNLQLNLKDIKLSL